MNAGLTVTGKSTLNGTLTVADNTATTLGGTLLVKKATTIGETVNCASNILTVNGKATFKCESTFENGIVIPGKHDLDVGGDINVDGNGGFSGNLEVDGNLTVKGNTQLGDNCSDTLTVTATSTFNCATTVKNTFRVQGNYATTLEGTLTVADGRKGDLGWRSPSKSQHCSERNPGCL